MVRNIIGRAFKKPKAILRACAMVLGLAISFPLSSLGLQSVSLAWDPSTNSEVTSYNVYIGAASGAYTNRVSVGAVTNAAVAGLVEGTTYFFVATATDASGLESDPSNEISYSVPLNTTNQPPTLNALSDLVINENAPQQTVDLSGITSGASNEIQTLIVTAVSSDPGLIPDPAVNYASPSTTGTLRFTPLADASGSATITVTVNDGQAQNNLFSRSFSVTVNAVNQPPTLDPLSDLTINENAGTQTVNLSGITSGASNELQALTITASSSNPQLIPNPLVNYISPNTTGSLTFTPATNSAGTCTISVTVNDGQPQNNLVSRSFTVTVNTNVLAAPQVVIQVVGKGKVLPDLSVQNLTAGTSYTLAAVPDPGQMFAGWTGSISSPLSNLTFVLTSNLTLVATFAASPFVLVSGTYSGLFYEDDEVRQYSAGAFAVTVTPRTNYSARLQIGANRYSFTGFLNSQGQVTNVITRHNDLPLQVELSMGRGDQSDQIFGRVTDGLWVSSLWGERAVFNSKTNPAPYAASYTWLLPGQDGDADLPAGDGFGTVRVNTAGQVRLAGTLAEGTRISLAVSVFGSGLSPLYIPLYSGRGSLVSWLAFTNRVADDFNGLLSWIKPADTNAHHYAHGFTNECNAIGSVYMPPATSTNLVFAFTNAQVEFVGGDLSSNFTNWIAIGLGERVSNLSSNRLALTFSTASGTFSGSATDPSSGKSRSFNGAVFQKMELGCGFLLGTNRSSRVVISQ